MPFALTKTADITKPATTAPMEMRLLVVLQRKVNSVITAADISGRNKISQENFVFHCERSQRAGTATDQASAVDFCVIFIRQSFIEVKSSTCADWRLR